MEVPSTPWTEAKEEDEKSIIKHTFTHFHLILRILTAHLDAPPARGTLIPRPEFRPADLPTVMRKAWDLARATLDTLES